MENKYTSLVVATTTVAENHFLWGCGAKGAGISFPALLCECGCKVHRVVNLFVSNYTL
jgi:hypothetical protein